MALPVITFFVCAKCRARFGPSGGGLCGACRRVFCLSHLRVADRPAATPMLCVDCRGPDAAGPASSIIDRMRVRLRRLVAWRRA
jgi:hypothetical protein